MNTDFVEVDYYKQVFLSSCYRNKVPGFIHMSNMNCIALHLDADRFLFVVLSEGRFYIRTRCSYLAVGVYVI